MDCASGVCVRLAGPVVVGGVGGGETQEKQQSSRRKDGNLPLLLLLLHPLLLQVREPISRMYVHVVKSCGGLGVRGQGGLSGGAGGGAGVGRGAGLLLLLLRRAVGLQRRHGGRGVSAPGGVALAAQLLPLHLPEVVAVVEAAQGRRGRYEGAVLTIIDNLCSGFL